MFNLHFHYKKISYSVHQKLYAFQQQKPNKIKFDEKLQMLLLFQLPLY